MPIKPQNGIHHDNSSIFSSPSEQQMNAIYNFCHNFGEYYQHFIMGCYRIAPNANLSELNLIEDKIQFQKVVREVIDEGYVFIDTISDFTMSYKGQISWIVIGFNNRGYLIDAISLHQEITQIKSILENPNIIKFTYRQCILLEDAKREWNAYGLNFFDFERFEKGIGVNKHLKIYANHIYQRPLSPQLQEELQERYNNMIKYLAQIRYYLEKQTSDYSLYGYSNHYQLLLKQYRHLVYSFQDEVKQYEYLCSQKRRRQNQQKQNNYDSNSIPHDDSSKKDITIKNERQRNLCQLFINWREHMARILDCPPRELLTFYQIMIIVINRPTSILEIQDILSKDRIQSLELASKILEILTYEAELYENHTNQLQIRNNRRRQEKNYKLLLSELKWQDREEWLNRRNDDSIKLYKEIVSIVELDGSVIEEFTQGMNKPPVTKSQINRFVKYAQYFRNGNHRRLKEYYESCPILESDCEKEDQLDGWQSDEEEELFIINKNVSNSLTSIADSLEKLPEKVQPKTVSSIKGPHSCYSLSDELEVGITHSKVEPLPQNIEQIYLKAVSVKKGYQKVQKKKGGRKQGKQQVEQFVPSWDQIKQLLEV